MLSEVRLRPKDGECVWKAVGMTILTGTRESTGNRPSSNNVSQKGANLNPIEIDSRDNIYSVAFLVDGEHIVSGDDKGMIRRWRIEDGKEVGTPMNTGSGVSGIAVSRDGKWAVSWAWSGMVSVWNVGNHSKVTEFKGHPHPHWVRAVDVSPNGTRIATGSDDSTVCVWSLSTGRRLLDPFKHDNEVVAVKFSQGRPGSLIATGTCDREAVRVYDGQTGRLLVEFPIKVNSLGNQSLAWASDNKQLFVVSTDGYIHGLDVSTGKSLSRWRPDIGLLGTVCIALASNSTFIAVSAQSSVSFWDTTTHKKFECATHHAVSITSMAILSTYDLVAAGGKKITVHDLRDLLLSPYCNVSVFASNGEVPNDKLLLLAAPAVP